MSYGSVVTLLYAIHNYTIKLLMPNDTGKTTQISAINKHVQFLVSTSLNSFPKLN